MARPTQGDYAALSRDFNEWLKAEGREKDDALIAIFAARMTKHGSHKFHGYSEKGICNAFGGDPYYMD
jgi:hypothetical protein